MAEIELVRVLVWDENPAHAPKEIYPAGINGAIAEGLNKKSKNIPILATTATLDDPEQGCSEAALNASRVVQSCPACPSRWMRGG